MDVDFLEDVLIDLRYLARILGEDVDYGTVRAAGSYIRKYLSEGGEGYLLRAWNQAGLPDKPTIITYTVDRWITKYGFGVWGDNIYDQLLDEYRNSEDGRILFTRFKEIIPKDNVLWFAFAGGGFFRNVAFSGLAWGVRHCANGEIQLFKDFGIARGPSFIEGYQAALSSPHVSVKHLPLHKFKEMPCIFVLGKTVNRIELIDYVCNKLGILHRGRFDEKDDRDRKLRLLEILEATVHTKMLQPRMTFAFYEFLSLGQSVINSNDVRKLMEKLEIIVRDR